MSPLTPAAAADLQQFAATHGATYLTAPDPVAPQRWTNPDRNALLAWIRRYGLNVPQQISRQDIFNSLGNPAGLPLLFLLTMMWGYQSNGAGAWRTERATQTPSFLPKLTTWFTFAQSNNLLGAYQAMYHAQTRIDRIGLAFASKIWYFAGYDETRGWAVQPLILDSRVHAALQATQFHHIHGPLLDPAHHQFAVQQPRDVSLTNFAYYQWYLQLAVTIRNTYIPGYRIDLVEYWLFTRANDII